ncbi:TonB-dependent receptor [Pseudoduganella sp. GCM10020061]|uniref:TonB-dependent receptor n=1 Tax=Pseudoduganella sp. GCM10020061 TaxID=3317345 RepID=UPI00362A6ADD
MHRLSPITLAIATAFSHPLAHADDVFGHRVFVDASRNSQLGVADSANMGTIAGRQLEMRTAFRPGELLEAMPGLVASQHSGEGKANQFYLRGFNLDHGTDLRTTLDGMPVNQRSHAHGQGWTDMNFVIPELVGRLDFRKGPYSAQAGDFAPAGSAAIAYANRTARSASLTAGHGNYRRGLVSGAPRAGQGNLLYALELTRNDGPFTRGDDYKKTNAVLRYGQGTPSNGFSVTAMAYRGSWNATDQVPQRAVEGGLIGRFDAIDGSDGGEAERYSLSALWRSSGDEGGTAVSAYVIRNRLELYSNFTYFMDDPVNGDQFSQPDRRVTAGLNATRTWHGHIGKTSSDVVAGVQVQHDNIFNALHSTRQRQVLSTTRSDHIVESSAGVFVENHTSWSPRFRTVAGVRGDHYRFHVRSDRAANSGRSDTSLASPSLSLVYAADPAVELYLNAGTGFHSNDARGTLTTIDPRTLAAADPVPGLIRSRGMEFGVRSEYLRGLQTMLSVYRLDFDSELTFVGDAGTTEAGRPSRRTGIELSNYYKPLKWLTIDLDLAYARARSRGGDPAGNHIPGAVEGIGQLAFTVDQVGPWSGSLRLRYFGPRPLVEDNSVRSGATATLNGRIGYRIDKSMRLELEGFNLANRRDSAIDYFYASQLKAEAAPREDVHFHPVEPRSARLTLHLNW